LSAKEGKTNECEEMEEKRNDCEEMEQDDDDIENEFEFPEAFFNVLDWKEDTEMAKLVKTLRGSIPIKKYPTPSEQPLSEWDTRWLDVMCFPTLFPTVKGSMFYGTAKRTIDIKLAQHISHYTKFVDVNSSGLFSLQPQTKM